MKNLIVIISLFIALSLKAQNFCEVYIPKLNNMGMGYKVIETQDGNYLTLSLLGAGGVQSPGNPLPTLTKLSKCGDTLWNKKFDSYSSGVAGLWEENDGSIEFATYTGYPFHYEGKIKLYKTTSNGDLIRKSVLADTTKIYGDIKCLKAGSNRYFFTGFYYVSSNKSYFSTIYIIADSIGNIIKRDSLDHTIFSSYSNFSNITVKNDTNLLFIGRNKDTAFVVINMDTNGNIITSKSFKLPIYQWYFGANYDGNEIIYFSWKGFNIKGLRIIKTDLDGNIKKDSTIDNIAYPGSSIVEELPTFQFLSNNKILFSNRIMTIIDSNLNFKSYYYDTTNQYKINNTIFTKDSFMVSVGAGGIITGGTGMRSSYYWFRKKSMHQLVQLLTLTGPSIINTNKGSIQITANIAPTEAINKQVTWSINDTNLATITQTGLVTAKANGTAIVTAQTTDGSNLTATKTISITNQNVGINEVNLSNQIVVFPNPASNVLTIKSAIDLTGMQLQLLDITGKVIAQYHNQTEIDISAIANGMYLLHIQTPNGSVVKQVVVNK